MFALFAVASAFVAPFQRPPTPVQASYQQVQAPFIVPVSGWKTPEPQYAPAALFSLGVVGLLQALAFPALKTKFRKGQSRAGALQMMAGNEDVDGIRNQFPPGMPPRIVKPPVDTWWGDRDYPSSEVLGIGKDVSSTVFGYSSALCLVVGCWCVAQSNLLNVLSGSTVNPFLVAGSLLVPYSWGLHVAAWIQRQNLK
jgi:hypothetical protein